MLEQHTSSISLRQTQLEQVQPRTLFPF